MKGLVIKLLQLEMLMLILFLGMLAGITSGFFVDEARVRNNISCGYDESKIIEEFGNYEDLKKDTEYTKRVQVMNSGKVSSYVRIFAEIKDPDIRKLIRLNLNLDDWTKGEDGFFYYNNILHPGQVSRPLLESFVAEEKLNEFEMICYCESVQSYGFKNAHEAFSSISGRTL